MKVEELAAVIREVSVLTLRPGDALVIYPSRILSEEEASGMADALHEMFPSTRILVTEHEVKVLRQEPHEEEGQGVTGDREAVLGDLDGDTSGGGGI